MLAVQNLVFVVNAYSINMEIIVAYALQTILDIIANMVRKFKNLIGILAKLTFLVPSLCVNLSLNSRTFPYTINLSSYSYSVVATY